jgi:hypothetical protein
MMEDPIDSRTRLLALAFIACFMSGVVHALLREPVQVSDALQVILRVRRMSSPWDAFVSSAHFSSTMLRPMDYAASRALLGLGDALGGGYFFAYRGFHALLAALLFALFGMALRLRTYSDVVVLPLTLTILTGLHTFGGMTREAYPINHFLVVAVCCLGALVASQSRGGWVANTAALGSFVYAVTSLESGILVWIVLLAAWGVGWRGVSGRMLVFVTVVLIAYAIVRVTILHITAGGLGDHSTGYGGAMLEPTEQIRRFGGHPLIFYFYNQVASFTSVLLSEPRAGVWALVGLQKGALPPPSIVIEIASSIGATAVVLWAAVRALRNRLHDTLHVRRILVVAGAVLFANAALSFAYSKDEIMSVAGVFYALAAAAALHELVLALSMVGRRGGRRIAACLLAALSVGWAWRSAGLEYKMRRSAADERSEWARVLVPGPYNASSLQPEQIELAAALKRDAIELRTTPYQLLPPWFERYWGD